MNEAKEKERAVELLMSFAVSGYWGDPAWLLREVAPRVKPTVLSDLHRDHGAVWTFKAIKEAVDNNFDPDFDPELIGFIGAPN